MGRCQEQRWRPLASNNRKLEHQKHYKKIFIQDKKKRAADLDRIWLETLLCLIGEAFDDASEDVSVFEIFQNLT